jgi:transposase-like protein
MSNSAKKSPPSRSKSVPSTAAHHERKPALSIIKDIQRQSRRQYTAEEKIRIVLEGLQGEQSVAEICRREGLNTNIYYRWIGLPKQQRILGSGQKTLNRRYHPGSYSAGSPIYEVRKRGIEATGSGVEPRGSPTGEPPVKKKWSATAAQS